VVEPAEQLEDLVLATSEAVSNSVEHGYRLASRAALASGVIEVFGRVLTDPDGCKRVELIVRDHGMWRPIPEDRGNRQHGMTVMRGCVAEVIVDGTVEGTTVILRGQPVPPPGRRSLGA
jgi:serine/threonine-protein kinase RsbW